MTGAVAAATLTNGVIKILGPALAIVAIVLLAFYAGKRVGSAEVQDSEARLDVKASKVMLSQYQAWIDENVAFAKQLDEINRRRDTYNSNTTKELADALAATASTRRDCRFPADSMLILREARDRAARAAAGGNSVAVP